MATRMQQRRGTAAQWTSANPILASGEIGFESDTSKFKIGDGVNHWADLIYYASAEELSSLIDGAPDLLNTLNELAAAMGDDPAFFTTVATNLSNHEADTTNIHGILNTGLLATQDDVNDLIDVAVTTHNTATTNVHGIPDTSALATSSDISTHNSDTTGVHGIADTSVLVTTTEMDLSISEHNAYTTNIHGIADTGDLATQDYADSAVTTHNTATTNVHGIADTSALATTSDLGSAVGDHNLETTNVHGIPDTSDIVFIDDSRLSDTRTPTDDSVSTAKIVNSAVTADKLAGDSVTEAKIADGAITSGKIANGTIVNADINASAEIDWTKLAISSTVSETELGYVDGVTSAIQTQIDAVPGLISTAKAEAIADATAQVNAVIASAPTALNTLDELAAALGDDANYAATVTTALDGKVASYTPIYQKTDSYTLSTLSERDSLIEMGKATAQTLTIPTNSSVAFTVGTSLDILQTGAGQVTIAGASGVTVNGTPGLKLRTQWSSCTLFKRAEDTWVVMGDLSA